ncbi:MAG TPA: hypothetical protein VGI82_00505 [Chitinophagaceae bacterium]|jgi:transposase
MIQALKIGNAAQQRAEITILKTLAYFDIFDYPLTELEIKNFGGHFLDENEFRSVIRKLIFVKAIFRISEFYSLRDDLSMAKKRAEGNRRAQELIPRAIQIGAFLYKFPYIKAVAISGSLSKNYADAKADIDFFIIARSNRLWIARTFLHLFKKITFLYGRQHFYCMNYFIDEKALKIRDQNIYSAMEVVTLLPAAGPDVLREFFRVNGWTKDWLPCYEPSYAMIGTQKNYQVKTWIENFFNHQRGDKLDNFLFKWTRRRWQKKESQGRRNLKGKIMNLVTGKHFSKSDPEAFQEKIVKMYQTKVDQLKDRYPEYFTDSAI